MKCPGQDMQYWNEDAIFNVDCPQCHKPVEFYKDDTSRKCGHCGNRFVNPKMDFGCAAYCQFAEQCLGTLPEEFKGMQDNLLKDKVAVEMKRHYKTDFKRVSRAMKTARHAENIGKSEGGNLATILCAAYLHEMDLPEAQSILEKLSADQKTIQEVSTIIEQYSSSEIPSSIESKIIHDAIHLYELQNQAKTPNHLFTQTAIKISKESIE